MRGPAEVQPAGAAKVQHALQAGWACWLGRVCVNHAGLANQSFSPIAADAPPSAWASLLAPGVSQPTSSFILLADPSFDRLEDLLAVRGKGGCGARGGVGMCGVCV